MFEVGFGEILMLALVTLLVVGPEQIPKVARTVGLWVGRMRRLVNSVRADMERELRAEEMKEFLRQQKLQTPIDELIETNTKTLNITNYNTITTTSSLATTTASTPTKET